MKYIFIADIHIKLGQKNVPKEWQRNRVLQLAKELNKENADGVIIGGDLLDVAKPSGEELALMFEFLALLKGEKLLIPGNHEMLTKTKDCFEPWRKALQEYVNCDLINKFETRTIGNTKIDFIPYNVIRQDFTRHSDFAVTHVRGEIPPHVKPEVDLDIFSGYEKVFTGDLHSFTNCQLNLLYPGSPFTTSFHRSVSTGSNGYFSIDMDSGTHKWVELHLPQLIRLTVDDVEKIQATDYHHTIYDLEGDLKEVGAVAKTELLDKKVVTNAVEPPKLDLKNTTMKEELVLFLEKIKGITQVEDIVSLFTSLGVSNENNNS